MRSIDLITWLPTSAIYKIRVTRFIAIPTGPLNFAVVPSPLMRPVLSGVPAIVVTMLVDTLIARIT